MRCRCLASRFLINNRCLGKAAWTPELLTRWRGVLRSVALAVSAYYLELFRGTSNYVYFSCRDARETFGAPCFAWFTSGPRPRCFWAATKFAIIHFVSQSPSVVNAPEIIRFIQTYRRFWAETLCQRGAAIFFHWIGPLTWTIT